MIQAVIFDFDGVVIDSKEFHHRSWTTLASELGKEITDQQFEKTFGMKNEKIISEGLSWSYDSKEIDEIALRKETIYRDLIRSNGMDPLPGVVKFLKFLKKEQIPTAIATSAPKENLMLILEVIQLESYFDGFVTAEDVKEGKPHPEPFLAAAKKIHANPIQSLVIEDAPVGIEAAKAAGMIAVAITTAHSKDAFPHADYVIDHFDELKTLWDSF